jgi:CheY-like chemotaxis protein
MVTIQSTEKNRQPLTQSHNNGYRILVVEDEAIIAMDIESILRKMGFSHPEIVHSGEESIQKVAAGRPHLVLMDIKLKGNLDGIQAAKQIFYHYHVPVVYITAFGDESTLKRANGTARFGYITKPFEEKELQSTIQNALHKAYN